ncbi:MAG: cation:proton antiporter family protein [Desulfobacterales bacterium]
MDPLWIVAAFFFGTIVARLSQPPLVGYLVAGFVLNSFGIEGGQTLQDIANAGVTLLLFTIGLKLKIKSLIRPEVWAGATIHMVLTVAVLGAGIWFLAAVSVPFFRLLNWESMLLVAFALSFSSTIFAVKVFEVKNEIPSRHAATAIGILIIQDILAVAFLATSTAKLPSPWALALFAGLLIFRPLLVRFLSRCGHGELLVLFGILMTVIGYRSFEVVGLKGDLGALVFGTLLATHPKASELANRLLGFKDLFLVGFFLSIGLSGTPTWTAFGIALLLVLAVPFKAALFFAILTRFKLRARTAILSSLSLTNYSEFGLIVAFIGVANSWIGKDWLIVIAISLSITFVLAAPLNAFAHNIYARFSDLLKRFETATRLKEDEPIHTGEAEVGVIGMGGVGTAAYEEMQRRYGDVVIAMDFSMETVERHRKMGRNVVYGDADDSDFWERVDLADSRMVLIMLALPDPQTSRFAVQQLQRLGFQGRIAASVRYEDEIPVLQEAGIDAAYSLYEEAGVGFVDHVCSELGYCRLRQKGAKP